MVSQAKSSSKTLSFSKIISVQQAHRAAVHFFRIAPSAASVASVDVGSINVAVKSSSVSVEDVRKVILTNLILLAFVCPAFDNEFLPFVF